MTREEFVERLAQRLFYSRFFGADDYLWEEMEGGMRQDFRDDARAFLAECGEWQCWTDAPGTAPRHHVFILKGGEADSSRTVRESARLRPDVTTGSAEAQEIGPQLKQSADAAPPAHHDGSAGPQNSARTEPAGPDLIRMYAERHGDKWRGLTNAYWLARLMQEVGELASTLVDDHEGPLEHELAQIGSICWNWLDELSTQASGGVEQAPGSDDAGVNGSRVGSRESGPEPERTAR